VGVRENGERCERADFEACVSAAQINEEGSYSVPRSRAIAIAQYARACRGTL
jgi:hypothetical protein